MVKSAGFDDEVFEGTARVFDGERAAMDALEPRADRAGDVVVIRYEGPKGGPGMREMLAITGAIKGAGLGKDVLLAHRRPLLRRHHRPVRRPHGARGGRRRADRVRPRRRPDPARRGRAVGSTSTGRRGRARRPHGGLGARGRRSTPAACSASTPRSSSRPRTAPSAAEPRLERGWTMRKVHDRHRRPAARVHRGASRCSSSGTAPQRVGRARERVAEGAGRHLRVCRRPHGRLPRPHRERRRDDRAPARERPDRGDVLLLRAAPQRGAAATDAAGWSASTTPEYAGWAARFPVTRRRAASRRRRGRQLVRCVAAARAGATSLPRMERAAPSRRVPARAEHRASCAPTLPGGPDSGVPRPCCARRLRAWSTPSSRSSLVGPPRRELVGPSAARRRARVTQAVLLRRTPSPWSRGRARPDLSAAPGTEHLWTFTAVDEGWLPPTSPRAWSGSSRTVPILTRSPSAVSDPRRSPCSRIGDYCGSTAGNGSVEVGGIRARHRSRTPAATEAMHLMAAHVVDDLGVPALRVEVRRPQRAVARRRRRGSASDLRGRPHRNRSSEAADSSAITDGGAGDCAPLPPAAQRRAQPRPADLEELGEHLVLKSDELDPRGPGALTSRPRVHCRDRRIHIVGRLSHWLDEATRVPANVEPCVLQVLVRTRRAS